MDLKNMSYNERCELAENPSTPVDVLRELAKDEDWQVRWEVSENPSTPIDALQDLATDEEVTIRTAVAKNPKVSSKILIILFEYEKSFNDPYKPVIKALYDHKNLPAFAKRVIETLYKDWI